MFLVETPEKETFLCSNRLVHVQLDDTFRNVLQAVLVRLQGVTAQSTDIDAWQWSVEAQTQGDSKSVFTADLCATVL